MLKEVSGEYNEKFAFAHRVRLVKVMGFNYGMVVQPRRSDGAKLENGWLSHNR